MIHIYILIYHCHRSSKECLVEFDHWPSSRICISQICQRHSQKYCHQYALCLIAEITFPYNICEMFCFSDMLISKLSCPILSCSNIGCIYHAALDNVCFACINAANEVCEGMWNLYIKMFNCLQVTVFYNPSYYVMQNKQLYFCFIWFQVAPKL